MCISRQEKLSSCPQTAKQVYSNARHFRRCMQMYVSVQLLWSCRRSSAEVACSLCLHTAVPQLLSAFTWPHSTHTNSRQDEKLRRYGLILLHREVRSSGSLSVDTVREFWLLVSELDAAVRQNTQLDKHSLFFVSQPLSVSRIGRFCRSQRLTIAMLLMSGGERICFSALAIKTTHSAGGRLRPLLPLPSFPSKMTQAPHHSLHTIVRKKNSFVVLEKQSTCGR